MAIYTHNPKPISTLTTSPNPNQENISNPEPKNQQKKKLSISLQNGRHDFDSITALNRYQQPLEHLGNDLRPSN